MNPKEKVLKQTSLLSFSKSEICNANVESKKRKHDEIEPELKEKIKEKQHKKIKINDDLNKLDGEKYIKIDLKKESSNECYKSPARIENNLT